VYGADKTTPAYNIRSLFSVATAIDNDGEFYDAQLQGPYGGRGGVVKIYSPGKRLPDRVITQRTDNPAAVALDTAKNVYVVNAGNVTVYRAGATSLLRTVSAGLKAPSALAIDSKGYLYVADKQANTVTVYAPSSTNLVRTIRTGIQKPRSIALDARGKLYVANARSVTVYNTATGALLQTISKGVLYPSALKIGR
jgi:DNA-binding beta-propeller fold protein YncE